MDGKTHRIVMECMKILNRYQEKAYPSDSKEDVTMLRNTIAVLSAKCGWCIWQNNMMSQTHVFLSLPEAPRAHDTLVSWTTPGFLENDYIFVCTQSTGNKIKVRHKMANTSIWKDEGLVLDMFREEPLPEDRV